MYRAFVQVGRSPRVFTGGPMSGFAVPACGVQQGCSGTLTRGRLPPSTAFLAWLPVAVRCSDDFCRDFLAGGCSGGCGRTHWSENACPLLLLLRGAGKLTHEVSMAVQRFGLEELGDLAYSFNSNAAAEHAITTSLPGRAGGAFELQRPPSTRAEASQQKLHKEKARFLDNFGTSDFPGKSRNALRCAQPQRSRPAIADLQGQMQEGQHRAAMRAASSVRVVAPASGGERGELSLLQRPPSTRAEASQQRLHKKLAPFHDSFATSDFPGKVANMLRCAHFTFFTVLLRSRLR